MRILIICLCILVVIVISIMPCFIPGSCKNQGEGVSQFSLSDPFPSFLENITHSLLPFIRANKMNSMYLHDAPHALIKFLEDIVNNHLKPNTPFVRAKDRPPILRYYNTSKLSNPYENLHYDRRRYAATQLRLVIVLYDDTNSSSFCFVKRCDDDKEVCTISQKGQVTLINANKLLHSIKVSSGERLILIMDLVNDSSEYQKRGFCGSFFTVWDYVWLDVIVKYFIGNVR